MDGEVVDPWGVKRLADGETNHGNVGLAERVQETALDVVEAKDEEAGEVGGNVQVHILDHVFVLSKVKVHMLHI